MDKPTYREIKEDILEAIEEIGQTVGSDAEAYLREHIVFDDAAESFKYTGDNLISIWFGDTPLMH